MDHKLSIWKLWRHESVPFGLVAAEVVIPSEHPVRWAMQLKDEGSNANAALPNLIK